MSSCATPDGALSTWPGHFTLVSKGWLLTACIVTIEETLGDEANGSTGLDQTLGFNSWATLANLTQSGVMSSKGNGKWSQSGWKRGKPRPDVD